MSQQKHHSLPFCLKHAVERLLNPQNLLKFFCFLWMVHPVSSVSVKHRTWTAHHMQQVLLSHQHQTTCQCVCEVWLIRLTVFKKSGHYTRAYIMTFPIVPWLFVRSVYIHVVISSAVSAYSTVKASMWFNLCQSIDVLSTKGISVLAVDSLPLQKATHHWVLSFIYS